MAKQQDPNSLGAMMAAQNELASLNAGRLQNSQAEQAFLQQQQAANAVMMQAAQIGASGGVGQQVGAMNPQTQAILAQYGITGTPAMPGKTTSTSKTTQSGGNVKIENNTTTNNDIKIVNPGGGGNADAGNQAKFQAWLSNAFAKQGQEYEVQRRAFARRDRDLEKQSNKMMRELEKSTKGLSEKLNPENWQKAQGNQMKTFMTVLLLSLAPLLVKPITEGLEKVKEGIKGIFGGKEGDEKPLSAVIKESFGIKEGQTFFEKLKEEFTDVGTLITEWFKAFFEERKIAIEQVSKKYNKNFLEKLWDSGNGLLSLFKGIGTLGNKFTDYLGAAVGGLGYTTQDVEIQIKDNAKKREGVIAAESTREGGHRYMETFKGGTAIDYRKINGNVDINDQIAAHEQTAYLTNLLTNNTGEADLSGIKGTLKQISRFKDKIRLGTNLQTRRFLRLFLPTDEAVFKFMSNSEYILEEQRQLIYYYEGTGEAGLEFPGVIDCAVGENIPLPENSRLAEKNEMSKWGYGVNQENPVIKTIYYLTQSGKTELERIAGNRYNNGKKVSFSNIDESIASKMFFENQSRLYGNDSEYLSNLSISDQNLYEQISDIKELKADIYSEVTDAKENLDFWNGTKKIFNNLGEKITDLFKRGDVDSRKIGNSILETYKRVSAEYGEERTNSKGESYTHGGIDYAVKVGTPVYSPIDGIVSEVGNHGDKSYGKFVKVKTGDGHTMVFGHLSEQSVKEGDHVGVGMTLGKSGNTGRSTGPHLHFEVRDPSGKTINPSDYFSNVTPESESEDTQKEDSPNYDVSLTKDGIPYVEHPGGYIIEFDRNKYESGITNFDAISSIYKIDPSSGVKQHIDKNLLSTNSQGAVSIQNFIDRLFSANQYPELLSPSLDYPIDNSGLKKEFYLGKHAFSGTEEGKTLVQNTFSLLGKKWDGRMEFWVTYTKDYKDIFQIRTYSIKTRWTLPQANDSREVVYYCTGPIIFNYGAFPDKYYDLPNVLPKNLQTDKRYNPIHYSAGIYIPTSVFNQINEFIKSVKAVEFGLKHGIYEISDGGTQIEMKKLSYDEEGELLVKARAKGDLTEFSTKLNSVEDYLKTINDPDVFSTIIRNNPGSSYQMSNLLLTELNDPVKFKEKTRPTFIRGLLSNPVGTIKEFFFNKENENRNEENAEAATTNTNIPGSILISDESGKTITYNTTNYNYNYNTNSDSGANQ